MKSTFLQLGVALVLTLSACGGGSGSLKSKVDAEHTKLLNEHHALDADHAKMEKEFRNLDAKYLEKVKNKPDSAYINFVNAHKATMDDHSKVLDNHKGLLEALDNTTGKPDKDLQEMLNRTIEEDKKADQAHKEMQEKHAKFLKELQEMIDKIK